MAPDNQAVRASFGVYKPVEGCTINDVLTHVIRVASSLETTCEVNITILKSKTRSWVAAFCEQKGQADQKNPWTNLPQAAAFTKGLKCPVRMVDFGWFELVAGDQKMNEGKEFLPLAQYGMGDIVSVRRIFTKGGTKQEKLVYCCLAVLKAFFKNIKGMMSYNFYRSLDGKKVIGLGKWENTDFAYGVINNPDGCPAEAYWNSVGPKKLKYEVCEVVYVTQNKLNP
ncbi:hypothetical protein SUGI_0239630 [Cryptomeria japonica]|uniref:uncharacterized protein LOC131063901 n=1 Tax=Cryptomeria japonica TaxID=3369 RepID=UPI002408D125|nr:uncharacterized protein LOC131063901 [Cryptomeria japonica]GLJ14774.1 hypothetical protein SUGI_0239630 [Cryptomeria japonica]